MVKKSSLLLLVVPAVSGQWQAKQEFYVEHRESGVQTYYSPELYVELDPESKNYREYRYDLKYGKDYYWSNYDGGIFSEREFVARYNQLTYYTDENDELRDWGYQMALAGGIAGACCVTITIAVVFAQCIIRRRQRRKELKAQKELAELEGLGGMDNDSKNGSEVADKDTDGNITKEPDTLKKPRKTSKQKKQEALAKKEMELAKAGVVMDFSADDMQGPQLDDPEGSRREMLSASDTVRPSKANGVGSSRFDQ